MANCIGSCRCWRPAADIASAKSRSSIDRDKFGSSKYGIERFIKGILDLLTVKFLTGFGQRPQHVLGSIGLVSFFLGGVDARLSRLSLDTIAHGSGMEVVHLSERPVLIYSLALLLLGGQLMSIGFLAELFIAYHSPNIKTYSISERAGVKTPEDEKKAD